jgi:hypothetical protein
LKLDCNIIKFIRTVKQKTAKNKENGMITNGGGKNRQPIKSNESVDRIETLEKEDPG